MEEDVTKYLNRTYFIALFILKSFNLKIKMERKLYLEIYHISYLTYIPRLN